MKRIVSVFGLFLVCIFMSSCATIMSGSNQKILVNSSPDDAKIVIFDQDNMKVWESTTPSTVSLKKADGYFSAASYRIEISKEGYKKQQVQISSRLNGGWYIAGNFLVGGLIGWVIIDPLTGGMWTLSPRKVDMDLARELGLDTSADAINFVLLEDIPSDVLSEVPLISLN